MKNKLRLNDLSGKNCCRAFEGMSRLFSGIAEGSITDVDVWTGDPESADQDIVVSIVHPSDLFPVISDKRYRESSSDVWLSWADGTQPKEVVPYTVEWLLDNFREIYGRSVRYIGTVRRWYCHNDTYRITGFSVESGGVPYICFDHHSGADAALLRTSFTFLEDSSPVGMVKEWRMW